MKINPTKTNGLRDSSARKRSLTAGAILCLFAGSALAGPRTGGPYRISTDTVDAGGARSVGGVYTNDGSVGDIAGVSTVAAPAETAKIGYIGQLFQVTGLTLTSGSPNVNEGADVQLGAWQALDDATFLAVPAASVAWSVQSGPITSIASSGLATAGIVYQNTAATAQGVYLGQTGTLGLTVQNVNLDDFGTYADDGIGDDWQVGHFGLNNPQGAAAANPDGDGLNNLGEWGFGLDPTVGNGGVIIVSGGLLIQRGTPDTRVTNIPNGVDFRAVFGRRKNYQLFGLTYMVQFSDANLTVWETNPPVPPVPAPTVIATNDPEIDAVTVPYPFFLSTGRKAQFFRVTITRP